ncbi:MAG: ribosome biogenesis GTP-binding protein YihA/YsxC [Holophagales bacterium]|nr:ribosome biogenesis GTP-binding protein YihA/YsxC [Holophagales bacterium]
MLQCFHVWRHVCRIAEGKRCWFPNKDMAQLLGDLRFFTSASDVGQLGFCHAEVAFVGRSNVGKSSMLNAIAQQKQLARVSKTPGRTRLINIFVTGIDRWVVDLPGYGFASGPVAERLSWRTMIEGYLTGRKSLRLIFILVDAEVGPTKLDIQMIDWLRDMDLPYRVVATKTDRVKPSKQASQRKAVAAKLGLQSGDIAWVSAVKGAGIAEFRREVTGILES